MKIKYYLIIVYLRLSVVKSLNILMTCYSMMYEPSIKNAFETSSQDKTIYVIQSYYDQDDALVFQNKFHIFNGQPDNIENLSCDELKHILLRHGMWPQYTKRIKNLERVEREFWKLYDQEVDLVKKGNLLEDIANMQSIVSNCYATAKEFLVASKKGELVN